MPRRLIAAKTSIAVSGHVSVYGAWTAGIGEIRVEI